MAMAVAHLLLQLSAAAGGNGGSRNSRMVIPAILLILLQLLLFTALSVDGAASFSFTNACQHPVWVGALHGASSPPMASSGFYLAPSATSRLDAPSSGAWSGTFWARTGCGVDSTTGRFSCATADCGTGDVACQGRGPAPPVSLVEVTLAAPGSGGPDFYDVSLVDGFNVPVVVSPQAIAGGGQCPALGCPVDLNCDCPPAQRAAEGVACRGPPEYFKNRCPLTRTTPTDVEPVPQSCRGPGELKVVFCQATIVTGAAGAGEAEMVIRSVVADS